jgi:hypothetical protein
MGFRDVTSDERAQVYDWPRNAATLKRRVQILFEGLVEVFQPGSEASHTGIQFSLNTEAGNILLVKTPLSEGRVRFRVSPAQGKLVATCLVERVEVDSFDSPVWIPVWEFYVAEGRSIIYVENLSDMDVYQQDRPGNDALNEVFERTGRSIAYALSAGPLLKT